MRFVLAPGACLLAIAPALAGAQAPVASVAPVAGPAIVTRDAHRMTATVEYRLPPEVTGVVPTAWRAYAGARSSRTLRPVSHGLGYVSVSGGVYRFTTRARMGAASDRSGGFCVAPDFAAVGLPPVDAGCIDADRPRRRDLTAYMPEATVFGDSVDAAFDWVPGTRDAISRHHSVRFDLRTCRRLLAAPCLPGASSVLSAAGSLAGSLGDVAVVNVGYNDWAGTYDVPRVMRALRARGVRRVVWVTLRETQSSYRQINAEIRLAARRSSRIQVADWGRASRGRPWFGPDQVHLTTAGAWGMAAFTRREIRKAVAWLREHPGA